jgi:hypothetical protein
MKKNISNIESLVKKVIEESLQEKADELTQKVKTKMDEYVGYQPTDIAEYDSDEDFENSEDDYVMDKLNRECKENPNSDSCKKHKEYLGMKDEMSEELHGGQKKLDKNKNGKLDKEDFEMLRKKGETEESSHDDEDSELNDILKNIYQKHDSRCSKCGGEGCKECDYSGMKRNSIFKKDKDKSSAFDRVKRGQKPEDISWEDIEEDLGEEVEEGNEFSGELAKARKSGKSEFEVGGKTYPVKESKKNIKQGWKSNRKSSVKESIELTESEMIDLIEKIVKEEKNFTKQKPKGLSQTEKVLSANKKENEKYISDVTKKLKEYLKYGSKEDYTPDAKHFPKGNGELAKMEKKGYSPDDITQEYIDNFTAAGLENLVYDEINPDEEWVSDNIEGSSRTGNNPEWANAVDTGLGKKKNKQRKENLLGAVKQMAYNKSPQPITNDDAKAGRKGKFDKNFGKDSGKKAIKILNHLESVDDKKEKLVKEEFDRIGKLMNYNQKTQ